MALTPAAIRTAAAATTLNTSARPDVAIGTDMDGGLGRNEIPEEITTSADLPRLADELRREGFDEAARVELVTWLLADPLHRKAYDKAARLWLLAGLVPPVVDVEAWKKSQARPSSQEDA